MKKLYRNRQLIEASHAGLKFSGRIDHADCSNPLFIYPASLVRMRCSGSGVRVLITNYHNHWNNYIGVIIDGKQTKHELSNEKGMKEYVLAEGLENIVHDVILFKRMDGCHYFQFHGFLIDKQAEVLQIGREHTRRIEVYGDSVSAGEVSEAEGYEGKEDPSHNGEYSNVWHSYAWYAARYLNAELHNIAQGGIALLDQTGYFRQPDQIGMLSVYDKLRFNPELGSVTSWDFEKYRSHIIVIAIGQNDSFPNDIMKEDFYGERGIAWRNNYKRFILALREINPKSLIILSTTIMEHDCGWDEAIELVCRELDDKKTVHFLYKKNGMGTKGHIRIKEAKKMGKELAAFIESFGEEIWRE